MKLKSPCCLTTGKCSSSSIYSAQDIQDILLIRTGFNYVVVFFQNFHVCAGNLGLNPDLVIVRPLKS